MHIHFHLRARRYERRFCHHREGEEAHIAIIFGCFGLSPQRYVGVGVNIGLERMAGMWARVDPHVVL